jgi:hypothetical protein
MAKWIPIWQGSEKGRALKEKKKVEIIDHLDDLFKPKVINGFAGLKWEKGEKKNNGK